MAILIYFQGNAGNLYLRKDKLFQLLSLVKPHFPLKIVAYHLSGYGDSDGKSNEYELKKDALLVYDTVKKEIIENNVNDYKLIIYGHSLGAAVSLHLSSQRKVDGLILENGISSIEGMVKYMYPRWLPYRYLTKWFLTEKWDGKKAIEEINEKKKKKRQAETEYLFLLSENDSMVPSTMSKEMFEALESKQKQFMGFNHANHDNIYLQTGYKSEVLNFFKRVMKK
ncbi:alpha/beta-hydrolase [Neoconidiobolus thromboides FSU 785]|nr:alpha/beta-hydrolase [Neoconidiobolus thromboides FSU 785]